MTPILTDEQRKAILAVEAWQLNIHQIETELNMSRWRVLDAAIAGELSASLVVENAVFDMFKVETVMQARILYRLTEIRDLLAHPIMIGEMKPNSPDSL